MSKLHVYTYHFFSAYGNKSTPIPDDLEFVELTWYDGTMWSVFRKQVGAEN